MARDRQRSVTNDRILASGNHPGLLDRCACRANRRIVHTPHTGRRARVRPRLRPGAATADAIYGCVAGFGLTFISSSLVNQQGWLRLVGGAFLCYLGIRTLLARPADQAAPAQGNGLIGAYASTFLLTLTNPMTILSFTAVFAGLGLADTGGEYGSAATLVLGVFAGSTLWWLGLSSVVSLLRPRSNARALRWVNRASGVIIAGFGLMALLSLV